MATELKMAAIYQNMACQYGQLQKKILGLSHNPLLQ